MPNGAGNWYAVRGIGPANLHSDGKSLAIIVVNPLGKAVTKTVHVKALGRLRRNANVWTIADADDAHDPEATNSFARPDRITCRGTTLTDAAEDFSYTFPAYSVTLMELLAARE